MVASDDEAALGQRPFFRVTARIGPLPKEIGI
jgi:hypothetical protein